MDEKLTAFLELEAAIAAKTETFPALKCLTGWQANSL
jgi:hypothetical protein